METAGVRELKNRLSEFLRQKQAGHELTGANQGRPIARLDPGRAMPGGLQGLIAAGRLTPGAAGRIRGAAVKLKGEGPLASEIATATRSRY